MHASNQCRTDRPEDAAERINSPDGRRDGSERDIQARLNRKRSPTALKRPQKLSPPAWTTATATSPATAVTSKH